MTDWIKPEWTLAPASSSAILDAAAWAASPLRNWYGLEEDRSEAMARLLCVVTRPHAPEISLRYLQAFGNGELVQKWGAPHPRFAHAPRKKRSERVNPVIGTDALLQRALLAGKALKVAWEASRFPGEFGSALATAGSEIFDLGREHSMAGQSVDLLPPSSDVRKKLFSDFIPVLHVAMAFYEILAGCGVEYSKGDGIFRKRGVVLEPGELLHSLAFEPKNAVAVPFIVRRAEDIAFQVQRHGLIERPERMIALRRANGEIFPADTG